MDDALFVVKDVLVQAPSLSVTATLQPVGSSTALKALLVSSEKELEAAEQQVALQLLQLLQRDFLTAFAPPSVSLVLHCVLTEQPGTALGMPLQRAEARQACAQTVQTPEPPAC